MLKNAVMYLIGRASCPSLWWVQSAQTWTEKRELASLYTETERREYVLPEGGCWVIAAEHRPSTAALHKVGQSVIDWEKTVKIVAWKNGPSIGADHTICQYPAEEAVKIIARSTRWDDRHCTANVRQLDTQDRLAIAERFGVNLEPCFPVIFEQ
ncbi:MAG: hypothetical protein ACYSW8_33190 [Planctomycetota bacterium]|jgi:hypothetical protein